MGRFMHTKPSILVAPLDWGLGHAMRCIPLIRALMDTGMEVHLGATEQGLSLLSTYFPACPTHLLPPYNVRYDKKGRQVQAVLRQTPWLIKVISQEYREAHRLHQTYSFAATLSDHRYGIRVNGIPSIFLGHQLALQLPPPFAWGEPLLHLLHAWFLGQFDQIWIPDVAGEHSLAGKLTQLPMSIPTRHIGWLSRFSTLPTEKQPPSGFPIVALLSGPEPQRTLLEQALLPQLAKLESPSLLLRGKPMETASYSMGNMQSIPFADGPELANILRQADVIIARSGYSSLMDFEALTISHALLIPTPGQTEQVYLAKRLAKQNRAHVVPQASISLPKDLEKAIEKDFFREQQAEPYAPLYQAVENLYQKLFKGTY